VINIKILGVRHPERYAVRRSVLSAQNELQAQYPDLAVEISEINDPSEIGKTAFVKVTLVPACTCAPVPAHVQAGTGAQVQAKGNTFRFFFVHFVSFVFKSCLVPARAG
jgi:hypothetical protein